MIFFLSYLIIPLFLRCVKTKRLIFLTHFTLGKEKKIGRGKKENARENKQRSVSSLSGKGDGVFCVIPRQKKRKRETLLSTETADGSEVQ